MRNFPAWFEDDATNPNALILKLLKEILEFGVGWVFFNQNSSFFPLFFVKEIEAGNALTLLVQPTWEGAG